MLWSIDSYQNRASADKYHLAVPRAQVSTHRGRVFVEVIRWQITSFKWSQAQVYFFQGCISNMLCLCHYGPALLGFWFQTDLGSENSASFFKSTGEEDLILPWSRVGHALRPIFILWLVNIWQVSSCGKIMQHLENCLLWQLKLTEIVMFLAVYFLWMYKMKYSCYQECSLIHCWFVYWVFGWEVRRLSKPIIRFRMASFLFFTLLDVYENYKGSSDPCLTW